MEAATDEVVPARSTIPTFAVGAVELRLQSLGRKGRAQIVARSTWAGSWSGGTSYVNTRRCEELRREVCCDGLHRAVSALVHLSVEKSLDRRTLRVETFSRLQTHVVVF